MLTWKFVLAALWMGALAVADIRRMRVPIWLLAVGSAFVTIVSLMEWRTGESNMSSLLWSLMPGIALMLVAVATKKAGWADGIVLLFLGLLEGIRICMTSLVISLFAISVISLALLCLKKVGRDCRLPYLPFLWIGYILQAALLSSG